jgi:threonine dehydrogenase-like Zn-dependent dehydrogenase
MRRIAAVDGAGRGVVVKQRVPAPKAGQVLIHVEAATISPGSELSRARRLRAGEAGNTNTVQKLGYQNSGRVIEVGRGVKRFKPGDRVAAFGGGYAYIADFAVVPQNLCCPLPDKVSYAEGAYGNVMLTGLHAIRRGEAQIGEDLLVVGLGIVGQFAAQFGRIAGLNVMAWDRLPFRCRIARQCGAHAAMNVQSKDALDEARRFTEDRGFDLAVVAIGGDGTDAVQQTKAALKTSPDGHTMGRVVLVGAVNATIRGGSGFGNADVRSAARTGPGYHDDEWEHGRTDYPHTFMRWTTRSNFELALKLMARGDLKVKPLTTHTLPIGRIDEVISAHLDEPHKTLGTVLVMD